MKKREAFLSKLKIPSINCGGVGKTLPSLERNIERLTLCVKEKESAKRSLHIGPSGNALWNEGQSSIVKYSTFWIKIGKNHFCSLTNSIWSAISFKKDNYGRILRLKQRSYSLPVIDEKKTKRKISALIKSLRAEYTVRDISRLKS